MSTELETELTADELLGISPASMDDERWRAVLRFYRSKADVSPATFEKIRAHAQRREDAAETYMREAIAVARPHIAALTLHVRYDLGDDVIHRCTCQRPT
jgi:hypothetical protein